jgi:hypothetical protein
MPNFTYEEIKFEDEQLADLEQMAEETGLEVHDIIRAGATTIFNMHEKEKRHVK